MKKILVAALLFMGPLCACVASAQDPNFHIYLAFGQSNMEGVGTIEAQDRVANDRIQVLQDFECPNLNRAYGQWYTAVPPLFGCWGNLGVADYFAKTLAEATPQNIRIGIVPTAVGGSDIALFQKSAPIGHGEIGPEKVPEQFSGGYAWLLDLARKSQKAGVIKGIIFHQGETNTSDPQWKYKVKEVVTDLRMDLNLGDVPFLAGEMLHVDVGGCCGSHNSEVAQLPSIIANAHVISASGLLGADEAHFDSASYREFGRRYGEKMLQLVEVVLPHKSAGGNSTTSDTAPAVNTKQVSAQPKSDKAGVMQWLWLVALALAGCFNVFSKKNPYALN